MAFVFENDGAMAGGFHLEHGDDQRVLVADLRWLFAGMAPKTGTPVVRQPFQVHRVGQGADEIGLAAAGQPAHQHEIQLGHHAFQLPQQKLAHGLVAALDQRVGHPGFFPQQLLGQPRAQAAAKTVEITLGVCLGKGFPAGHPLGHHRRRVEGFAQGNSRILPGLLVAYAHLAAFLVGHDGPVDTGRKGPLGKLHRRAHIHQRHIVDEQLPVRRDIRPLSAHESTPARPPAGGAAGQWAGPAGRVRAAGLAPRPARLHPRR